MPSRRFYPFAEDHSCCKTWPSIQIRPYLSLEHQIAAETKSPVILASRLRASRPYWRLLGYRRQSSLLRSIHFKIPKQFMSPSKLRFGLRHLSSRIFVRSSLVTSGLCSVIAQAHRPSSSSAFRSSYPLIPNFWQMSGMCSNSVRSRFSPDVVFVESRKLRISSPYLTDGKSNNLIHKI